MNMRATILALVILLSGTLLRAQTKEEVGIIRDILAVYNADTAGKEPTAAQYIANDSGLFYIIRIGTDEYSIKGLSWKDATGYDFLVSGEEGMWSSVTVYGNVYRMKKSATGKGALQYAGAWYDLDRSREPYESVELGFPQGGQAALLAVNMERFLKQVVNGE